MTDDPEAAAKVRKIVTSYSGGYLTIKLLGTKTDSTYVKMTNEKLSTTNFEVVYEDDDTLAPGTEKVKTTPYTGSKWRTYRNLYDAGGKLISSSFEASSDYKARNKVILRGPAVQPGSGSADIPADPAAPAVPSTPADTPSQDGTAPAEPDFPAEPENPTIVVPEEA